MRQIHPKKVVICLALFLLPAALLNPGQGAQAASPARPLSGNLPPDFAAGAMAMTWSTFLGGSWDDQPFSTAVDANGNVYVAGYSLASWGSPIRSWSGGFVDAYVAKLNSAGALQWNTFLGGSQADHGYGVAVDATGNVYVTGWSAATWGTPLNPFAGDEDAFVAKLNTNGVLQMEHVPGRAGLSGRLGDIRRCRREYLSGRRDRRNLGLTRESFHGRRGWLRGPAQQPGGSGLAHLHGRRGQRFYPFPGRESQRQCLCGGHQRCELGFARPSLLERVHGRLRRDRQ